LVVVSRYCVKGCLFVGSRYCVKNYFVCVWCCVAVSVDELVKEGVKEGRLEVYSFVWNTIQDIQKNSGKTHKTNTHWLELQDV